MSVSTADPGPPLPEVPGGTPGRQKSGLVRAAGPFDAFLFAQAGISVGIMASWGLFFGTSSYPGSSLLLAMLISVVVALPIAYGYQYWSQVFPRSGGDYVFLSRSLPPGLAFGLNFTFVAMVAASPAIAVSILQPLCSAFAHALGAAAGWGFLRGTVSSWLNTNAGFAVVGTVPLIVTAVVGVFGLKRQLRWIRLLFVVGAVGITILTVALLLSSSGQFAKHLLAATGLTASQVEGRAAKAGFQYGGFSLGQTFKLTNWLVASLFFVLIVTYLGGEIKDVRRSVRRGMVGAILVSAAAVVIYGAALSGVVPGRLQGALAFNSTANPAASTPGVPYAHELMDILWGTHGGGLVLTIVGYVTMLSWACLWVASLVPFAQRAILAWSFDGLIPRRLGFVTSRRHTPLPALIGATVLVEAWLIAFAFAPSLRTIVLLAPMYVLIGVTMAVGVIFPFTRKHFYGQSPIARSKVFGMPSMSVACALATAVIAVWTWLLLADPIASGTNRNQIWIVAAVAAAVVLYYFGLRRVRRAHGDDIETTFKEIPIE